MEKNRSKENGTLSIINVLRKKSSWCGWNILGLGFLFWGLISSSPLAGANEADYAPSFVQGSYAQVYFPPVTYYPPPVVVGPPITTTWYGPPVYVNDYQPVVFSSPVIVRSPWRPFLRTFIP